jgi:hypothetical protein
MEPFLAETVRRAEGPVKIQFHRSDRLVGRGDSPQRHEDTKVEGGPLAAVVCRDWTLLNLNAEIEESSSLVLKNPDVSQSD